MKTLFPGWVCIFIGCTDDDRPCLLVDCESDASTEPTARPEVRRIAWDCCDADSTNTCTVPGESWYDITLDGIAEALWLDIGLTDGEGRVFYQESHELPLLLADSNANWSTYFLELEQLAEPGCETLAECPEDIYEPGIDTLYSCIDLDSNTVNWTLQIVEREREEPTHCVHWGADIDTTSDCSTMLPDA